MKFTIERNNENMDVLIDPQKMPRLNIFGEEEIAWLIGIQPMGTIRTEELGLQPPSNKA